MKNKFAKRLQELRKERGLSVNDLAKATGFSHVAILRWEKQARIPNVETLFIFCEFFNCDASYLIGLTD